MASALRGIDVSHHQGRINWFGASRRVQFAAAKATDDLAYVDPLWRGNRDSARNADVIVGGYHFARPRPRAGDAAAQAEHFVGALGDVLDGDLSPVLDLERNSAARAGRPAPELAPAHLVEWALEFLVRVERETGRRPVLYTGPAFYADQLGGTRDLDGWPLWIAHYTSLPEPRSPRPWTFWQHSSTGRVPGIAGDVDLDRFHGSRAQLLALAHADIPAPPPAAAIVDDGGDTVPTFIRQAGHDPVYVTNGITRRWVRTPEELAEMKRLGLAAGDVKTISNAMLRAIVLVGPDA